MKPRRKADGSSEFVLDCPLCGSRLNFEVNSVSGLFNCWACHHSGKLADPKVSGLGKGTSTFQPDRSGEAPHSRASRCPPTQDFPEYVLSDWERRQMDKSWILKQYRPFWDGESICFPTFGGQPWRRSPWAWSNPKVRAYGDKGLLLPVDATQGRDVVLVEGDYKACAIPLPWLGVAIGGVTLSEYQGVLASTLRPSSWTIMLDGGKEVEAEEIRRKLRVFSPVVRVAPIPYKKGPDDVTRTVLLKALLVCEPSLKDVKDLLGC